MTYGRAHVDSSHVDCVVPARQGHLQLQIVLIVLGGVGYLRDQLFLLEIGLRLRFRLSVRLRRDARVQIYLGGRVHAQVLIHTGSGLHELHIFLTKLAVEGLANMLPLDFSEHAEIVLVDFFDLNLLVVLV